MVSLYHIPTARYVPEAPIKSQACEDNFYKELEIETALSNLEGVGSRILQQAIKGGPLPKRFSEDHHALLLFVLVQASRTPAAAEEITAALNTFWQAMAEKIPSKMAEHAKELEIKLENPAGFLLTITAESYPLALDLRWKVLRNKTARPFITSDHPAVMYNQFLEHRRRQVSNTGTVSKGLQIFLPLSPKDLLVLFDRDVYKVGGKKLRVMDVDVTNEDDVDALNLLQVTNADDTLYFSDTTELKYVKALVQAGEKYRRPETSIIKEHTGVDATTGEVGQLHQLSRVDIRTNMKLRCISVLTSASGKLDNRAVPVRDPHLCDLFEAFRREAKAGKYKQTQFGKWLRDKFGEAEPK